MPHYKRNLRFLLFLVFPVLAFLLGWSLNQQQNQRSSIPTATNTPTEVSTTKEVKNFLDPIKLRRRSDPRDVDLSAFWEVWNTLDSNFLYQDRFKTQDQIYGATKGLVASLNDPYTVFMTPTETNDFEESMSGEFEGIGAEIAIKKNRLTVVTPLKGTPAELAGLRSGDRILKIDTLSTFDMSINDAITKIRGPRGQKVVLTVERDGDTQPHEITIVRDTIVVNDFSWKMQEGIAVLEITQFGTELVSQFSTALPSILLEKPKGIIVDLRNNGGGLLDASVKVLDQFFGEQVLVTTNGRQIGQVEDLQSKRGGAFLETPVIILINRGSASASEIFAGAMQDTHRGLILGEQSFGKGSVQNVIPMSGGASLKVTIAEWLTPNGRSIHDEGITPDIEATRTREEFEKNEDPVMERAFELFGSEEMQQVLNSETEESITDVVEETPVLEVVPEEEIQ
jgi:carboxyl-terminal processing protease